MNERGSPEFRPMQIGEDTAIDAHLVAEAPAVNSFDASVLAELEKIRNPKGTWMQTIVILVVSLALFVSLGKGNNPIAFTAMLIAVLFVHETGHYLGMRVFGYRNVRMFFIPMFGAAVSGQKTSGKGYQEAIVTLLGPLPGLCIAAGLLVPAFIPALDPKLRQQFARAAFLFAIINGFNLLPILPLDGGRLANEILFSRNRYLEMIFQIVAAAVLSLLGVVGAGWFFLFLGIWLLLSVGVTFKISSIAQRVGRQFIGQLPPMDGRLPMALFGQIVGDVKAAFPGNKTPKGVAAIAFRVWEKMQVRRPGAGATVAISMTYLAGCLFAFLLVVITALTMTALHAKP
jgi:Zn-dependent protease